MAATACLMSFSSCFVCGFDSYPVFLKCPQRKFLPRGHLKITGYESTPHTIQELKDISHADAAITITMLHPVYLNMVTAQLFTNCSNTLRYIHTNARENITKTRAKRKAGYVFVAHPVLYFFFLSFSE